MKNTTKKECRDHLKNPNLRFLSTHPAELSDEKRAEHYGLSTKTLIVDVRKCWNLEAALTASVATSKKLQ